MINKLSVLGVRSAGIDHTLLNLITGVMYLFSPLATRAVFKYNNEHTDVVV